MDMENNKHGHNLQTEWFAIKTRQDFKAEKYFADLCDEVFFPKETVRLPGRKPRQRAIIPHVLFIRTDRETALALESRGRTQPGAALPFWIYRYPTDNAIQVIPSGSIDLLRLLTADDTTRCEIFNKKDFRQNEYVRITGGFFAGRKGYVQRIKKNKHVVVRIEGICLVMLPFIHPDLLEPVTTDENT